MNSTLRIAERVEYHEQMDSRNYTPVRPRNKKFGVGEYFLKHA
jgi:hypothetical protein